MSWRIHAPGKLFVLGEYAVLDGAPALVAAVDRGVRCEVLDGDVLNGAGLEVPGDDRFARAGLDAVGAPADRRYRFSDWNPTALPEKPGFGGSAAATVAACVAGRLASGRTTARLADVAEIAALAAKAHRAVQGSGSGMDVMASALGGLRRHRIGAPPSAPLPAPPALLAVWSGRAARTGPRVTTYLSWAGRGAFVSESEALVEAFTRDPLAALREAYALLRAMALAAGVDYDTPALARVGRIAARFGGAAKPSGAGGGDVAVALLPDPEAAAAFARACDADGLAPIPVSIPSGVQIQELNDA